MLNALRFQNIALIAYLDDILIIDLTLGTSNVHKNVETVLKILGFFINDEKCNLNPSKECKYLGFVYNSKKMIMFLPPGTKDTIFN